jgi:uncharacterized protein (DUF433 family)/DNA-binding transcriptional MerR regulator
MPVDIYGGQNPLEMPLYSIAEAARYLRLPASTARYWSQGGFYSYNDKKEFFAPLITVAGSGRLPLSFSNLVELHVLKALRRVHDVSLEKVRVALNNAKKSLNIDKPLLHDGLMTYGSKMFVDHFDVLYDLSNIEQAVLEGVLREFMERVQRDAHSIPIKLYPHVPDAPLERPITIDPEVAFGKPTLGDTGIRTSIIRYRLERGESTKSIAENYDIDPDLVTSAAMYEYRGGRAA